MFKKLLSIFGIIICKTKSNSILISKHANFRAKERISNRVLLNMVAEIARKEGTTPIHFDYQNKNKNRNVYAKLYNGYVFIFDKEDDMLITLYESTKLVELFVIRK